MNIVYVFNMSLILHHQNVYLTLFYISTFQFLIEKSWAHSSYYRYS